MAHRTKQTEEAPTRNELWAERARADGYCLLVMDLLRPHFKKGVLWVHDAKVEGLYEFCAARGHLADFDAAVRRLEQER